ncbi:RpiR family transcriptional regulator [Subtercola boreus]|uniref:RpiR family transcriptional regulator n=1 Tax=Subtercola boreus TaxID=120213 RepID=A0A3E0VM97_9MICO|nr:MurR/RpiR family transcriptional regulator [Subtercola boreus]RFA10749.1 RpiR family transcriptional regulator [Subtercola boreus]TQL55681.1 RpiR family transcriptional regulator [Subtercola boreus]
MLGKVGNHVSPDDGGLTRWLGGVQSRSGDLAPSETKVVHLLLADPLFVGTSTTAQVAARAGVSAPSVVRAARAVGFTGFTELKLEIARARGTTEFFAPPGALDENATTAAVLETAIRTGADALGALGGALDPAALDQAVGALRRAGQVIVIGAGTSAAVAADAVFRFRALGLRVSAIPDHESAMIAMRLLSTEDVVIAVSSTGRTASTLSVADAASSSGATLVAITNQSDTPLAVLADVALVVGGAPLQTQMAAAGSRLAQLVVVDTLAAALALGDPDRMRRAERAGIDLPDIT